MPKLPIELEWFLTVPGLLVSGGVLLLLIALILFIASSVKTKKETKRNQEFDNAVETNNFNVDPVVNETNVVEDNTPVEPVVPSNLNQQMLSPQGVVEQPKVEEPVAQEKAPVIPQAIVEETRVVEPVTPVAVEQPVETPAVNLEIPVVNENPNHEPYGGAAILPEQTEVVEQPAPEAYGGADVLANTQQAPVIKEEEPEVVLPVIMPEIEEEPVVEPTVVEPIVIEAVQPEVVVPQEPVVEQPVVMPQEELVAQPLADTPVVVPQAPVVDVVEDATPAPEGPIVQPEVETPGLQVVEQPENIVTPVEPIVMPPVEEAEEIEEL